MFWIVAGIAALLLVGLVIAIRLLIVLLVELREERIDDDDDQDLISIDEYDDPAFSYAVAAAPRTSSTSRRAR